ncbi:hypothetical protein B0H11DRAFT_2285851 [Mycena galericulata]|nr:hypothetical protein B0H11DRAFT_2285851 [Mycena galericulata]
MRDFSQELIDLVLDHVSQDGGHVEIDNSDAAQDDLEIVPSIAACGLVCSQWLPRSRFHLFADATLDAARLGTLFDIDRTSSLQLFSLFRGVTLEFFTPDPFKPEHMDKLCYCVNLAYLRIFTALGSSGTTSQFSSFLETHLPILGIRCVSLSRFEWEATKDTISLRTIADVLNCLPVLEAFSLEFDGCRITDEEVPSSHSCPTHLRTLVLEVEDGAEVLFAWFLSLPVLPSLASLTLHEVDQSPGTSLTAYSERAGSGFESLCLWPERASLTEPTGILKYATGLRHLTLYSQATSHVPAVISTLPSANLRTLTIWLSSTHSDLMDHISLVPYAQIDQALAHTRFGSLERFSLETYSYISFGYVSLLSPEVRRLMPLANAREILA